MSLARLCSSVSYLVKGWKPITPKQYWKIPANVELKAFGVKGFTKESAKESGKCSITP